MKGTVTQITHSKAGTHVNITCEDGSQIVLIYKGTAVNTFVVDQQVTVSIT